MNLCMYLCIVQYEGGVIVVGVVSNPLVNHCHMAIDLLAPFLQRPVLSTLPPIALSCPATEMCFNKSGLFQSKTEREKPQSTTTNYYIKKTTNQQLYSPGCHDYNKHVLFPDHSPEITIRVF